MPRPKGIPKTGGRKKGSINKLPTIRACVEAAFHNIGGQEWLEDVARKHPVEFLRVAAKFVPQAIEAKVEHTHTMLVARSYVGMEIENPPEPLALGEGNGEAKEH